MSPDTRTEIINGIAKHTLGSKVDFLAAEVSYWAAVIASALGVINVGAKWFEAPAAIAVIAGIPGFVLLIDKHFQYNDRSAWHADFKNSLNALLRLGRDPEVPDTEIDNRLSELEKYMAKTFPSRHRMPPSVDNGGPA